MPEPKLYAFSTTIAACAKQFRTFVDLAETLKMDVHADEVRKDLGAK
jgi:hypothetical protein